MNREPPAGSVVAMDADRHPAVEAWTNTGPDRAAPDHVLVLREARRRSVYRLPGVGSGGSSVIAKRSRVPVALLERRVYEEILPGLPLATPHYYGSWFDGQSGWILLEDVSGESYFSDNPAHHRLLSEWVGRLHATLPRPAGLTAARALPDAGAARYLDHLVQARGNIRRALDRLVFSSGEAEVLETLVAQCHSIEADWEMLAGLLGCLPDTLVHGDIQAKNIFLQARPGRYDLRVIDWEMVGFGCPGADLTRIDLEVYWSTVRHAWPDLSLDRVNHLATVGHLFQALAEVHWLSKWLGAGSAEGDREAVTRLNAILSRLGDAAASVHRTR